MVWFQCEDCGENLKKPKLANHFRMCSAHKLSCIDCGQMFDQQSVQSHTQCITEAEKYGPKGHGNAQQNGHTKPDKPKKNSDVDVNVGLSSRPPWFCSLCNTQATSKQTLLLHADGKKHRAKARAFHNSQKQSQEAEQPIPNEKGTSTLNVETVDTKGSDNIVLEEEIQTKKRKIEASENGHIEKSASDVTNGEVIQADESKASQGKSKKKKGAHETFNHEDQAEDEAPVLVEAPPSKPKWKKLITSTLKSSNGVMKMKKLQKLVIGALKESGVTKNEEQLRDKLMHKISSSSRFTIENKCVRLVTKTEES